MEDLFFRYNPWWEGDYKLDNIIERPLMLNSLKENFSSKEIIFLTGLRRIGKTSLLKLFIKRIIEEENVQPDHIFYISLDDYLLARKNIFEMVEEFRKIHRITFTEKVFLFLDEITYQKDFELQLKNLYDNYHAKIYASSSSSSILKSRKPYLTGRYAIIELLPLDFTEYLEFKGIKVKKRDRILLDSYFEEYLQTGGVPEYVLTKNHDYIRQLVDDIIYKDIVSLYSIKNPQTVKDLFLLLMERAGKVLSINRISRILGVSPDTAKRFLTMFSDTYLIYLLPRYGKVNETLLAPKKVYASDLGIKTIFTGFRDKGSMFENYVFLRIKHLSPSYIYENGTEIDFFTKEGILLEAKYGGTMNEKQSALYNTFKAKGRFVINSNDELERFIGSVRA